MQDIDSASRKKPLDQLRNSKRGLEESIDASREREEAADPDRSPGKVGEGLGGRGIEHGNPSLLEQLSTDDLREKARLLRINRADGMSRQELLGRLMAFMET